MNIKKIEGKILDLSYKHDNEITLAVDDIIEIIRQAIKQVVESVPVEENVAGIKTTQWLRRYGITDEDVFTAGQVEEIVIDYHSDIVQEIKQWKKKILKELKEEK